MKLRPEINPGRINYIPHELLALRLEDDPLSNESVIRTARELSKLGDVVTRFERVRSQGRISFGRDRAYEDGVVIYVGPDLRISPERTNWETVVEDYPVMKRWGNVQWHDVEHLSNEIQYILYKTHEVDSGDPITWINSLLDPMVQLMCHASSQRGWELQIRRGVMSEGRVRFHADPGEPGVGLHIPSQYLLRAQHKDYRAPGWHIATAYGKTPPRPRRASRHNITTDPTRLSKRDAEFTIEDS